MMKKLLLLAIGGALSLGADAQQEERSILFEGNAKQYTVGSPIEYKNISLGNSVNNLLEQNERAAAKGTGVGGSRWYDYFGLVSRLNNNKFATNSNTFVYHLWHDSTVREYFGGNTNGYLRVNFSSASQIIDPITSKLFNDASTGGFKGQVQIKNFNSYKVDSVYIRGAYVRMPSRPSHIVDTLIFSVAPQGTSGYDYGKNDPDYGAKVVSDYLSKITTTDTSIFALAPLTADIDTVGRTMKNGISWKIPLTSAMGDTPATANTYTVREFTYPVPNGGLTVPAGQRAIMTVTFKSGDQWVANVDTIRMFNRFMPITGYINANTAMPYYIPQYDDFSTSGLMFSWVPRNYTPSIMIELWNTPGFNHEFHNMAMHMSCANCDLVSVEDVAGNIQSANAYPNPASAAVAIPFSLKNASDVKVTLMNTFGQVVSTENFTDVKNGTANFNVANIASGLYMYTVEANGEVKTGRVSVTH